MTEKTSQTYEYQTKAKKMLDIVIHSLYTNKDIFVRELISNASDAIGKLKYISLTDSNYIEKDLPFEIKIEVDEKANSITISDTGIGMTKEELIENLGTIAHSSTETFFEKISENKENGDQLIGQFGVGFYSAFMVAKNVRVISRSYKPESKGWEWTSDGVSNYTISQEESIKRGTRIVIELADDQSKYHEADTIKNIIKEYSNFVAFPILLNDEVVNTIKPIWVQSPKSVTEDDYKEFYKFLSNTESEPYFQLHTSSDAPIQMNALLYFPKDNMEIFGFNRTEPAINLYCNKILIESKVKDLLPEYLRFIKGIVDSEDLPLNISRETLQDNMIIGKLKKFLTKRVISFLQTQKKEHLDVYTEFWKTFSLYIKEGANSDWENNKELAKLLLFESRKKDKDTLVSLDDYISLMPEEQKDIYYITGNSRAEIENSPYLETFKANDMDVLFLYDPIDDFVMTSIREYDGKKLVSADQADLDIKAPEKDSKKKKPTKTQEKQIDKLLKWINKNLDERVSEVKLSNRLVNSPALISNPDDAMTTNMQKILESTKNEMYSVGKKVLELNPDHELIKNLAKIHAKDAEDSSISIILSQIIDNAFLTAGLKVDHQKMIDRITSIMNESISK